MGEVNVKYLGYEIKLHPTIMEFYRSCGFTTDSPEKYEIPTYGILEKTVFYSSGWVDFTTS